MATLHSCRPRPSTCRGWLLFRPSPKCPVPADVPLPGEDVSFISVDSARLRSRATAAYAESVEALRRGLWTSAVVTGGRCSKRSFSTASSGSPGVTSVTRLCSVSRS